LPALPAPRKWIDGEAGTGEPLPGTAESSRSPISPAPASLVQDTRLLPFGMTVVSHLLMMTALPLLPPVFPGAVAGRYHPAGVQGPALTRERVRHSMKLALQGAKGDRAVS
jgi:hypothetical protein